MSFRYDVVVVGAGPAGTATAYHLARRGRDVLVVDRDVFPREKVCGDGLTPRAVDALAAMGATSIAQAPRIPLLRIWDLSNGSSVDSRFERTSAGTESAVIVPRVVLDHDLCQRAVAAGATFWPRTVVTALERRDGGVRGVRVLRDGVEMLVEAAVTVIAEGSAGRLGRALRGPDRFRADVGYAVRQYATDVEVDECFEVFFPLGSGDGRVAGYGWVFPAGETVNVGAGFFYGDSPPRKINLRGLYRDFLVALRRHSQRFARLVPTSPLIGAPLRIGLEPERCHGDGWLLVGDAAGGINPFTAEGIAYGLETGALAANAIDQALATDRRLGAYAAGLAGAYPRHTNLRFYYPRLFGFVERNYEAVLAGRLIGLADHHRRGGPIRPALRHLLSDHAPESSGLSVADCVAAEADGAGGFIRAVLDGLLGDVRAVEPLVSEVLRYVRTSASALIGLPAAFVWSMTRACAGRDPDAARRLAEALELFVAAHLILATVGPTSPERPRRYANSLALLWGDLLFGQCMRQLFTLPDPIVGAILDGTTATFGVGLARACEPSLEDGRRRRSEVGDCARLCAAGAAAAASLAGASPEVSAWARAWGSQLAEAHAALGDVIAQKLGDRALDLPPARSFGRQADTIFMEAVAHARTAAGLLALAPHAVSDPAALEVVTRATMCRATRLGSHLGAAPALFAAGPAA
jgi:geranylgeranyl reductase family protein